MLRFIAKFLFLLLFILSSIYLLNIFSISKLGIEEIDENVRNSILWKKNMENYEFFLAGDSVFCSYYVDNSKETIWGKFEKYTGKPCFPAALNGCKIVDLYESIKYLAKNLKEGSVIFLDIIPTRFSFNQNNNQEGNYKLELSALNGNLISKLKQNTKIYYPEYIEKSIRKEKIKVKTQKDKNTDHFNRIWDIHGDFALNRYKTFIKGKKEFELSQDIYYLEKFQNKLKSRNINIVFVLTPLNKKQIKDYSTNSNSKEIINGFDEINLSIVDFLEKIKANYINLYNSTPSDCFADMVHTNTCGDDIIARKLADYVNANKSKFGE